jgi:predicted  nucleic acid-binding Zn-ribbon protein
MKEKHSIENKIKKYQEQILEQKDLILKLRKKIDDITAEIERKGEKEQIQLQREVENLKGGINKR